MEHRACKYAERIIYTEGLEMKAEINEHEKNKIRFQNVHIPKEAQ
jgi:hypothetical protein